MNCFKVEIGSIPILIELDGLYPSREFAALYSPFITGRDYLYRIKVACGNRRGRPAKAKGVVLCLVNGVYKIGCGEFRAVLDLNNSRGSICLSNSWSEQTLVSALTNLSIFLQLNRGGIVFHASAIARGNRAYVFSGPSGAGKTTVAELSRECTVLSQELIGFDFLNRGLRAFAFPYYADSGFPSRAGGCFKVAGLFKLVKDRRNYLKPISKPRALAEFFTFPYDLRVLPSFPDYLERHYRLIESVACYELHFLPDGSFWRCIDGCLN